MREIVERLTENHQIEVAKSILESNGYKVTKKSKGRSKKLFESLTIVDPDDPEDTRELESDGIYSDFAEDFDDEDLEDVLEYASDKLGTDIRNFECYSETNVNDPEELLGDWSVVDSLSYDEGGYYSALIMRDSENHYAVVITNRDAYQFILYK